MRVVTCIAGLVCAAAVTAGPAGYLRTLGPVPLRFQSVAVQAAALPPLAMQEKADANASATTPSPGTNAPSITATNSVASAAAATNAISSSVPVTTIVAIAPNQESAPPSMSSSLSSDLPKVIEMLMPAHGAASTNGAGSRIVIMPSVPFTPPLPAQSAQPPSSSATYHSPPDQPIKTP